MTLSTNRVRAESSAKKVLISGAYATGKTTLCRRVCDEMSVSGISWRLVSEVPRQCPFLLNRDQTMLASAWLLGEQIRQESEQMVGGHEVVVCDRGVPDILSHTTILRAASASDSRLKDVIIRMSQQWINSYDVIFVTTIDSAIPIEADGIRVPDLEYQVCLQESIFDVFQLSTVTPIVLPQDTEERVVTVIEHVRHVLGQAKE